MLLAFNISIFNQSFKSNLKKPCFLKKLTSLYMEGTNVPPIFKIALKYFTSIPPCPDGVDIPNVQTG